MRGAFDAMEELPEGMDALAFNAWFTSILMPIVESGGEVITMVGRTVKHGEIPLGVATLEYHGQIAYPHHIWYPDASPRNKLEITLAFLLELKKSYVAFVFAEKKDENFFRHLGKFGVLRKVGKIYEWFGPKQDATLFQSVGN